jgi:hypothetical protein
MSARLERLIRIYNRLRRGPVTIEIISKWANTAGIKVSERQLYRDLNDLNRLRVSEDESIVEYVDEKNKKTWKLLYAGDNLKITPYDINTFYLLKNFAHYTIYNHRISSFEKFEKILYRHFSSSNYQNHIEANELYFKRTNFSHNMYGAVEHKKIEELIWALQNKRMLTIVNDNINCANMHIEQEGFPISIYPLELIFHAGRVHIGGLEIGTGRLVIFAVDDLEYNLTNETFARNKWIGHYKAEFEKLFGIAEPLSNRVYKIQIEFTGSLGNSDKNYFKHSSQQWRKLKNGNYMMELKCTLGRELFGFLGYNLDKIKVHKPRILKELWIKKLKNITAINEKDLALNEEAANADY